LIKETQIKEAYTKIMSKYFITNEYELFKKGVLYGAKHK